MGTYVVKNTGLEAVVKVYTNEQSGAVIDVPLSALAENGETVTAAGVKEVYWTAKPNKSVTIQRVEAVDDLEGGYYLSNCGHWHFLNFNDDTYSQYPFRFTFDGPGTVFIRLRKTVA